jgi:hypothetical protein
VRTVLDVIAKIIANIVNNPLDPKYRRLKSTNNTFQKKVCAISGGLDVFQSLGFRLAGEEWVMESSEFAWNNLVSCKLKLDKFLSRLDSSGKSTVSPISSVPVNSPVSTSGGVNSAESLATLQQLLLALSANSSALPQLTTNNSEEDSKVICIYIL